MKPFIKYAGGKRSVFAATSLFFPSTQQYDRYVEPFLGGGSVLLGLAPHNFVAADIIDPLMNTYTQIRDNPEGVMSALDEMQAKYSKDFFMETRKAYNSHRDNDAVLAATFIFLNKTCFNGLYRVNSKGEFNVPFGHKPNCPTLYERENLLQISEFLKRGKLNTADFRETMSTCGERDFIYLDPPYIHDGGFISAS